MYCPSNHNNYSVLDVKIRKYVDINGKVSRGK